MSAILAASAQDRKCLDYFYRFGASFNQTVRATAGTASEGAFGPPWTGRVRIYAAPEEG